MSKSVPILNHFVIVSFDNGEISNVDYYSCGDEATLLGYISEHYSINEMRTIQVHRLSRVSKVNISITVGDLVGGNLI